MGHKVSDMRASTTFFIVASALLNAGGNTEARSTHSCFVHPTGVLVNKREQHLKSLGTSISRCEQKLGPFGVSASRCEQNVRSHLSQKVSLSAISSATLSEGDVLASPIFKDPIFTDPYASNDSDIWRPAKAIHRERIKVQDKRGDILPARDLIIAKPSRVKSSNLFTKRKRTINPEENVEKVIQTDLSKWACLTDVSTLRLMFGTNKNKFWGDLDNETARRLYHSLLPRALISLYKQGLTPDELAPLAYQARCAAKQYVRERSYIPGRIFAIAYDGFRHLKKYGEWSSKGMSWDQIWIKYEKEIRNEVREMLGDEHTLSDGELTSKVCLRILEKSCTTNGSVDKFALGNGSSGRRNKGDHQKKVLELASKYENDVHKLLELVDKRQPKAFTAQEYFFLRLLVMARKKFLMLEQLKKMNDGKVKKAVDDAKGAFSKQPKAWSEEELRY